MTTLVYLHGFRSSPQSIKAQLFARAIAVLPPAERPRFVVPTLSHRPREAVASVAAWIEREVGAATTTLTLVGSSLGGFYATHLAQRFGVRAVLINPALRPYDDLASYVGPQRNLYTGDEVLDWRAAVAFYGGARQYVLGGGDHGWADFAGEIPAILRFARPMLA